MVLCLPAPDGSSDTVCAEISGWGVYRRAVEPAGRPFEAIISAKLGLATDAESDAAHQRRKDNDDRGSDSDDSGSDSGDEDFSSKARIHRAKVVDDHYFFLGLEKLRWRATDADIKKAYRKAVLMHHPDKASSKEEYIDDEHFKKIQSAYETLSDAKKRRAYDSQDDIDDSIPSAADANKGDFYDVFIPVFYRNARWSTRKKIPSLGDDKTPIDKVFAFYDFWERFESWRDFSYADEYDTADAESRDERRWMDRQNERKRKKLKKAERERIVKLVTLAQKHDPRIKRHREEERARAEAEKKAREEERLRKEEEERVRKQKEEEAAREKERQEKLQREREKKRLKKARGSARARKADLGGDSEREALVEELCAKLSAVELEELAGATDFASALDTSLHALREREEAQQQKLEDKYGPSRSKGQGAKACTDSEWTETDLSNLAKGFAKYPSGTGNRWEKIAAFMEHKFTVDNIIAKAREVKRSEAKAVTKNFDANAFERSMNARKTAGRVGSDISRRYDIELTDDKAEAPSPWSQDEQRLLEAALKTYPASLGKERWDKIAAAIPTRSKRECVVRFKELAALVKARKAAASGK